MYNMILSISPVYRRLFDGHMEDSADSHIALIGCFLLHCMVLYAQHFLDLSLRGLYNYALRSIKFH